MKQAHQVMTVTAFGQTESLTVQRATRSAYAHRRVGRWLPWLFMLLCGVAMPSLTAATATWTGLGANDLWTTAANWQGGVAPVAGDDLVFAGATRLTPSNNFVANTSFNSVTFAAGASAFTVGGAGITLAGNITNNSASTQTISVPMALNVAISTVSGSSAIVLSGIISEIGGARGITKTETGSLTFSGTNTYSGTTRISAGTAICTNTSAFGLVCFRSVVGRCKYASTVPVATGP